MKTELSNYEFKKIICQDYNIELLEKAKTYYNEFPMINGKKKINASYNSVIVDRLGNEHPYMINSSQRNDDKLLDFDYIYTEFSKSISDILTETGLKLKSEKCRICEGGGWYSEGIIYYYKNFSTEV